MPMRIGIAVDGSSPSRAGIELLAGLPWQASDHVTVIAIAEPPTVLAAMPFAQAPGVAGYMDLVVDTAEAHARQVAESAVERLSVLACPVTSLVRVGHPVQVLSRIVEEQGLDLLVVGPRGRGSLGSFLLGSVSQGLLQAMPTSILIARPPTGPVERAIVASDGSPSSLAAARFAADLPLPDAIDLRVLVSVASWAAPHRGSQTVDHGAIRDAEHERALAIAQEAIDVLAASGREAQPIIRDGDPKREIIDTARELDADLVVTGSRGLGGFTGLVLGSVSRGVSMAAPCSVLVVGGPRVEQAADRLMERPPSAA